MDSRPKIDVEAIAECSRETSWKRGQELSLEEIASTPQMARGPSTSPSSIVAMTYTIFTSLLIVKFLGGPSSLPKGSFEGCSHPF